MGSVPGAIWAAPQPQHLKCFCSCFSVDTNLTIYLFTTIHPGLQLSTSSWSNYRLTLSGGAENKCAGQICFDPSAVGVRSVVRLTRVYLCSPAAGADVWSCDLSVLNGMRQPCWQAYYTSKEGGRLTMQWEDAAVRRSSTVHSSAAFKRKSPLLQK